MKALSPLVLLLITGLGAQSQTPVKIKLTVTPSEGATRHSSYRTAHEDAAVWILRWSGK